jgi:hypothetical protein
VLNAEVKTEGERLSHEAVAARFVAQSVETQSSCPSGPPMFPLFLVGQLALQVWVWRRLIGRLKDGTLTRIQGAARYAGWGFLPVALFVTIYVAMVGLEEWWHIALIEERTALLTVPVLALSVVCSIGFAIRCAFVRRTTPTGD